MVDGREDGANDGGDDEGRSYDPRGRKRMAQAEVGGRAILALEPEPGQRVSSALAPECGFGAVPNVAAPSSRGHLSQSFESTCENPKY